MFRDFDAMLADSGRPSFTISGQKFQARARLPWKKFTAMLDAMRQAAESDGDEGSAATERFLTTCVVRADRERFAALLALEDNDEDDTAGITPAQIGELSEWLMEHYTGKLEGNEESSSAGPSSTGRQRKVVSLNARPAASAG